MSERAPGVNAAAGVPRVKTAPAARKEADFDSRMVQLNNEEAELLHHESAAFLSA